jgi:hypothetical protein
VCPLKTFIVVALIVAIYTVIEATGWPTCGIKKDIKTLRATTMVMSQCFAASRNN